MSLVVPSSPSTQRQRTDLVATRTGSPPGARLEGGGVLAQGGEVEHRGRGGDVGPGQGGEQLRTQHSRRLPGAAGTGGKLVTTAAVVPVGG